MRAVTMSEFNDFIEAVNMAIDALENLPSAEPRKKGKWIDKSDDIDGAWNYCSVCMEQAIDLYDFCPNCGADMREGEEG